jgi:hypothetical protein
MLIKSSPLRKDTAPNAWNLAAAVVERYRTHASHNVLVAIWAAGEDRFVAEAMNPGLKVQMNLLKAEHWRWIFKQISKKATSRSREYAGGKPYLAHRH